MPAKKTTKTGTTLVQKMHKVMTDLQFIKKDATNQSARYNYASEKAIKIALHDQFVEKGIVFTMSASNPRTIELKNSNGSLFCTVIDTHYKFMNVDDKDDFIEGTFIGSGNGRDDKGLYAAVTGALKYTLTSSFMIPTGDDAEKDGNRDVDAYKTPENEPEAPKAEETAKDTPKATKPVAAKPAPEASKPVAKKKVVKKVVKKAEAKAPDKKFIWGEPVGEPVMTEKVITNVLKAFGKYDINEGELEAVSAVPLAEWTQNIKDVALENFNSLEDGTFTKEDVIEL